MIRHYRKLYRVVTKGRRPRYLVMRGSRPAGGAVWLFDRWTASRIAATSFSYVEAKGWERRLGRRRVRVEEAVAPGAWKRTTGEAA